MTVKMVDITNKEYVYREAIARGCIRLRRETITRIVRGEVEKGDVFTLAKFIAIQGAKQTSMLLPFCHPIRITYIEPNISIDGDRVCVEVLVRAYEKTGVEMEALTSVAIALLNIWDMVKKYEKDEEGQYPYTVIEDIRVVKKVKSKEYTPRDVHEALNT